MRNEWRKPKSCGECSDYYLSEIVERETYYEIRWWEGRCRQDERKAKSDDPACVLFRERS